MKKKFEFYIITLLATTIFVSCTKVLDKVNLTAVAPSLVWSDAAVANAYLNNIYAALMPGNPSGTGNNTDEGVPLQRATNKLMTGTATFDYYDIFSEYNNIRTTNILLANIDNASFDDIDKQQIKGQGLFWRAWDYYLLTKTYGGVPLILTPQAPTTDLTTLALPRNKTSECVTQIIADLDAAIALLPDSWTGANFGRIDKGAALAFKGRVLLFFASPLFNPTNDHAKWQAAYDANLAAKTQLDAQGKGLFAPYNQIWDAAPNKEDVMLRMFSYPNAVYNQAAARPIDFSANAVGDDRPSLELVNAFPMNDGSVWNSSTMAYDTLFKHRDDRFYANICYNGDPIQYLADLKAANKYIWTYYDVISYIYGGTSIGGNYNQVDILGPQMVIESASSFYRIKAIDKTITIGLVNDASTNWPEIRYAEVLMNYGEAANELGNTNDALQVLYQIRARANILPGPFGNYGITAGTQSAIRTAYQNERFVEFAFENKRWDDLRRWKLFGNLRSLPQRHGLAIQLKAGQTDVNPMDDINVVWNKFTSTVYETDLQDITIQDQYYIYGIPKEVLDRNAKEVQNNNWGGSFDPLQ